MTNTRRTALIIDDEPDIRELLELTLNRMDIQAACAENLRQAHELLKQQSYQLCITDMNLPDGNGIELVEYMNQHHPAIPVAVLTAYGSMDTAIKALKAGAFDFVSKPVELQRLRDLINTAIKLKPEAKINETPITPENRSPILGESDPIKTLHKQIHKLARSQAPVYIFGESGSGKELVARQIHQLGPRADQAFVPVNCGAIPNELMESEFFGHRKGSFTGAHEDKQGLFLAAQGGTLFLDEIADLPIPMQVKLLRAIQEKAIRPIGAPKEISINVRILCATHRNLNELVENGEFRQDLFYRINVIQLNVPALRERDQDILLLANNKLQKLAQEWQIPAPTLKQTASEALLAYSFPGNVRELENIIERAVTLCDNHSIQPEHLNLPEKNKAPEMEKEESLSSDKTPSQKPKEFFAVGESLEEYLTDIEKNAILQALDESRWNRTAAAKKLGMSFRSLRYRLKKLGLDKED